MQKGVYGEVATEKFLKKHLSVAKHVLVQNLSEGKKASKKISFPLVLKIMSSKAVHKSDISGVRLVKTKADFAEEFLDLMKIVKKKKLPLDGILVQEYVEGESVLLGLRQDPVFGHVLAMGIGGIYTEVLKDVSFRVCPIRSKDAQEMIEELQMRDLLFGFRGRKKVNIALLKKSMVALSKVPLKFPEIQELDINPYVINSRSGKVVDARMRV